MKEYLKDLEKIVWTERVNRNFSIYFWTCLKIFQKNAKTMDHDRNLMLFLNIDSSIVCLLFFEKSYWLFQNYQNSFGPGWINRIFTNSCKSFFRSPPKNYWRRQFSRAKFFFTEYDVRTDLLFEAIKIFSTATLLRQTCLYEKKGAFLKMRIILKNEKTTYFFLQK